MALFAFISIWFPQANCTPPEVRNQTFDIIASEMPRGVYWTIAEDAKLILAVLLTAYAELAVSFYLLELTWLCVYKNPLLIPSSMACCED